MRSLLLTFALISSSALVAVEPAPQAADQQATIHHGAKPAFSLTLPAGWDAIQAEEKTVIHPGAKHPHIQVWATNAKDLAAATTDVAALIVSEVTHFTPTTTTDQTIAGAPAKLLIGTGEEADDGDPSNAEVTLFSVNGVVYVLVNHAEGDGAAKKRADITQALASLKRIP